MMPEQQAVYEKFRGGAKLVIHFTKRRAGKTWLLSRIVGETLEAGGRAAAVFPSMAMSRPFLEDLEQSYPGLRQNRNQLGIYSGSFLAGLQCVRSHWDLLVMDEPWCYSPPAIPFDIASRIVLAGTPMSFIRTEAELPLPDVIVWPDS